ncbi:hypothetical protein [Geobacter sp. AOG2]|uniref:hypothetical protein n=1 Tax=Geobacter sp. AOG2 TaxID=1566347 RepID=UPI001CC65448|nr:hypothetical protein [Geobacter sp. AOG2]
MAGLFFTSPYFLLVFLIVPAYTVLGLKLHFHVSGDLLLANNIAFALCIGARLVRYALRLRGNIRYGAGYRPPSNTIELGRSSSQLQTDLKDAGYHFDSDGHYGEKKDLGFLGTTLLYGGLLLLLLAGSYDYTHEYSVMGRLGVGEPMPLDSTGLLGQYEAGFWAGTTELPLLQVRKQILPNAQWPKGATEIALLSKDRKELAKGTIAPGKPFSSQGLDFYMTRFVFDALFVLRQGPSIAYESFVKLLPLAAKKGEYSYYGSLKTDKFENVRGVAWLNPEKKAVHVEAKLSGKKAFDGVLELWGKNKITQGEYLGSLEGLAQWSEIRVARGRHRRTLMLGAALVLLGGLLRLIIRPQRVWLEDTEEGSRVRTAGRKTLQLVEQAGKQ